MRTLKIEKLYRILLEEKEVLEIQTTKKTDIYLQVKNKKGILLIDEIPMKEINEKNIEKKQTKILKNIIKKNTFHPKK